MDISVARVAEGNKVPLGVNSSVFQLDDVMPAFGSFAANEAITVSAERMAMILDTIKSTSPVIKRLLALSHDHDF